MRAAFLQKVNDFICAYYTFILLFLVLALHLPFIHADPALNFDFSRGPYTDEGFYLAQLRNYLHGHGWNIEKADALLKSPLFAVIFFFPFKIFGTKLSVGRLFYQFYSLLIWLIIISHKKLRLISSVFFVVGFLQVYVFQYSHYLMPEILCCNTIMLAVYFFYRYVTAKQKRWLIISLLTFSSAYYLKNQFIYILALPVMLFAIFSYNSFRPFHLKMMAQQLFILLLFLSLPLTAYYFCWFLPHKNFYTYIFLSENTGRIEHLNHVWETVKFYYQYVFLIPEMKFYTFMLWVSLGASVVLLLFFRVATEIKFFLIAGFCFFLLELHKLTLLYIPLRYIVPLIYSVMFFSAVVIAGYLSIAFDRESGKLVRVITAIVVTFFLGVILTEHLTNISADYSARKFSIEEANMYLAKNIKSTSPVAGNWAATLGWNIPNETFPVSHWVINDERIFTSVYPAAIVTEEKEADSDGAYCKRGINLNENSDSVKTFKIGKWQIQIWWVKDSTRIQPGINR